MAALLGAEAKENKATKDVVHGGSNLEPLQLSPGELQAFVGFPRIKLMSPGCRGGAVYRAAMTLIVSNVTHFAIAYMSEALEFGHAILIFDQAHDICESGRILLVNSIASSDSRSDRMS